MGAGEAGCSGSFPAKGQERVGEEGWGLRNKRERREGRMLGVGEDGEVGGDERERKGREERERERETERENAGRWGREGVGGGGRGPARICQLHSQRGRRGWVERGWGGKK